MLVAIAIPIFTTQLEKSREATDAANLRAAYAEVMTAALSEDTAHYSKDVTAKQKDGSGWANTSIGTIGEVALPDASTKGWTVTFDPDNETVSITAKS